MKRYLSASRPDEAVQENDESDVGEGQARHDAPAQQTFPAQRKALYITSGQLRSRAFSRRHSPRAESHVRIAELRRSLSSLLSLKGVPVLSELSGKPFSYKVKRLIIY